MKQTATTETGQAGASLAELCAAHLEHEEALLTSALRIVQGMLAAFGARSLDAFASALRGHAEFVQVVKEMNARRGRFGAEIAVRLKLREVGTMVHVFAALNKDEGTPLKASATRVRQLAQELANLNFRVSVHLRVYLNAYGRILRDLTNTSASSGRYGPAGTTEAVDYRPLVHLHG